MPRTLPWLQKGAPKTDNKASSSPAPKRRRRAASPEDLVDANLDDIATPPPRPKQKKRADRTPSTSPAPAPPDVDYMRPGYNADDIYMLVEDVFHSTAKAYTQHLHYGEYVRLKKLSRSRGEKTLSTIGHGTDGRTEKSRGLKIREEREASERKKEVLLGADSESEEDDPYLLDPQLAGLMMKDKGVGRELAGMVKARSNTRAAAGFLESPHAARRYRDVLKEEEDQGVGTQAQTSAKAASSRVPKVFEEVSEDEEDEDDLDAAPARKPEAKQKTRVNSGQSDRSSRQEPVEDRSGDIFKRFAAPSSKDRISKPKDAKETSALPVNVEDDNNFDEAPRPKPARPTYKKAQNRQAASQALATQDENTARRTPFRPTGSENGIFKRPPLPSPSPTKSTSLPPQESQSQGTKDIKAAASGYLAKRAADRAREEQKQKQQGRAKRVDDIPTFLF